MPRELRHMCRLHRDWLHATSMVLHKQHGCVFLAFSRRFLQGRNCMAQDKSPRSSWSLGRCTSHAPLQSQTLPTGNPTASVQTLHIPTGTLLRFVNSEKPDPSPVTQVQSQHGLQTSKSHKNSDRLFISFLHLSEC